MSAEEVYDRVAQVMEVHPGATSKTLPALYRDFHGVGVRVQLLRAALNQYKAAHVATTQRAAATRTAARQEAQSDVVYNRVGEIMMQHPHFASQDLRDYYREVHERVDNRVLQAALSKYRRTDGAPSQAAAQKEDAPARTDAGHASLSDPVCHRVEEIMRRNPDFQFRDLKVQYRKMRKGVDDHVLLAAYR